MLARQIQRLRHALQRSGSRGRRASPQPGELEPGAGGGGDHSDNSDADGGEAEDRFPDNASCGSRASCRSTKSAKAAAKAAAKATKANKTGKASKGKSRLNATTPTSEEGGDAPAQAPQQQQQATKSDGGDMADEDEDTAARLKALQMQLNFRVSMGAFCAVLLAWVVGAAGLSLAWLLLLLVTMATTIPSHNDHVREVSRLATVLARRQRSLAQDESAEWLNLLVNRWWTFSSNSMLALLKERLEPILNDARPAIVESLELRELSLGAQTPMLSGLRANDVVGGRFVPLSLRNAMSLSPCHRVSLRGHLDLEPSDDFRCVVRTHLFGKGVGMHLDLFIERLHVSGNVLGTLTLDVNSPFPHTTHLSLTFVEKPDIWFSVRILKNVQAMEVPLLKTWIHSVVLDALVTSLVDPGRLEIPLMSPDRPMSHKEATDSDCLACGVLTVGLSINQFPVASQGSWLDDGAARWLALTLGSQRGICQLQASPAQASVSQASASQASAPWSDSVSFLVSAAQLQAPADRLQVKLKAKRLVGALTLAQYDLALSAHALNVPSAPDGVVVDTVLHRKAGAGRTSLQVPVIGARLEYTPLPPMPMPPLPEAMLADQPEQLDQLDAHQGGVLYVVVHGADGLSPSDLNECNPYCMIFNNRDKVKTTHYMRGTMSPAWESRTQILVSDFSQTSLSFVVCSWNCAKMVEMDLLGVAVLHLSNSERRVVQRCLALTGNSAVANITVSVAFQPVASVSVSSSMSRLEPGGIRERDRQRPASPNQRNIQEFSTFTKGKRNSNTWMHHAKMLLSHRDNDSSVSDISTLLANGQGLVEVNFIKARDLVAKDLNGYSDPFCEIKINGEIHYKTEIKKKTLDPVWEENAIIGMPQNSENLEISVWDHDIFGFRDFLGSLTFTCDDLRRCSAIDAPQWFRLKNTKSGSIELRVKVITEKDLESCSSNAPSTAPSVNSCTSSPRLPTRTESDRDSNHSFKPIIRRPSMERSRKLHVDPPPPPPRTVTLQNKGKDKEAASNALAMNINSWNSSEINHNQLNGNGTHSTSSLAISNWSPAHSVTSSPMSVPRLLVTSPNSSVHSSPIRSSLRSKPPPLPFSPNGNGSNFEHSDESPFKKGNEYSSLRIMKQKVKQGLRLRRFRSEINFHEETNGKNGATGVSLSLQPRSVEEADDMMLGEPLSHAVSQPSLYSSKPKRPTDLKGLASPRPDTYVGVEGKVLQAQGLHVAHVAQLYCRIKLQTAVSPEKQTRLSLSSATGKTVGKSHLFPAVPNPRFDLPFQLDSSSPISRQAALLFEIRSASKDIVASARITLQDLLSAAAPDTNEVHTWLALNNGATLEVQVAHGRELKKPARKLFRSWSVHRIGKI